MVVYPGRGAGQICLTAAPLKATYHAGIFVGITVPWRVKQGRTRTADPKIAAIHLLSLLESELLQRVLLGVIDTVKPESISGAVRRAVDVFLCGYERR
jgi:AefR-like transcriptional repressor, C-terminal domain